MGFVVWDLGFGVRGLGFEVWSSGFGVLGFGLGVSGVNQGPCREGMDLA